MAGFGGACVSRAEAASPCVWQDSATCVGEIDRPYLAESTPMLRTPPPVRLIVSLQGAAACTTAVLTVTSVSCGGQIPRRTLGKL
jgi:hypothetical protein